MWWVLFAPVAYISVLVGAVIPKRSINAYCHKHFCWDPDFDEFEGTVWDETSR